MRQAILVKYHGPTNASSARWSARAQAGRRVYDQDYSLDADGNAEAAALAYAKVLDWRGEWAGGALPNGDYVFCQIEE